MTREKKWTLAVLAAFAGASVVGTAYAAEQASMERMETHALSDTVVTAQRREKRDLDTPATTTIITAKEIEKAGYRNVFEAIEGTAPAFTCQDIRRHGLGAATPEECRRRCIIHTLVDSADAAWRSELAKKTIADLVSVLPSTLKHRTSTILSDAASGANRETGKPRR